MSLKWSFISSPMWFFISKTSPHIMPASAPHTQQFTSGNHEMLCCKIKPFFFFFKKLKTVKQSQLKPSAGKSRQWIFRMIHYANSWQSSRVSTGVNDWLQLFMTIKKPRKTLHTIFKGLSAIQITLSLRINLHVSPLRVSFLNQPVTSNLERVPRTRTQLFSVD